MNSQRLVKISKYLSYHLRHRPDKLGLELERGGWVSVEKLLQAAEADDFAFSRPELEIVIRNNDKQRFSFDETKTKIRANQGHSASVELELKPQTPPTVLYHGTGIKAVKLILSQGLLKMCRHHVHLASDQETARKVAQRKGKPVLFQVDAARLAQDGYTFYCSDNGVWLVDHVPPNYLSEIWRGKTLISA